MGPHWNHFAYLRADDRAVAALLQLSPAIEEAMVMPSEVCRGDGQRVLCIAVEDLDQAPDALRAEIGSIDIAAFDAFLIAHPTSPWWYGDDSQEELERAQARVRALMWLSRQIDGPVGYWYHQGNHGLDADLFIGFGPSPSMWANHAGRQGWAWDEAKPRSAYTAALWHIGAQVKNVDEFDSGSFAIGSTCMPLEALHNAVISSPTTYAIPRERRTREQAQSDPDVQATTERADRVRAMTEKLNRVFNSAPAEEVARKATVIAKWTARLKRWCFGRNSAE